MVPTHGAFVQVGGWITVVIGWATKIQPWINVLLSASLFVLACFQIYAHIKRNKKANRLYQELNNVRNACPKATSGNCPLEDRIESLEKEGLKLK